MRVNKTKLICFAYLMVSSGFILVILWEKITEDINATTKVKANIKTIERGLKIKIDEEWRILEMVYMLKKVKPTSSMVESVKDMSEVKKV